MGCGSQAPDGDDAEEACGAGESARQSTKINVVANPEKKNIKKKN